MKYLHLKRLGIFALIATMTTSSLLINETVEARNDNSGGAVFAMTNETAGNKIVAYGRSDDGTLKRERTIRTHGLGIGVDLDTQGGLELGMDNKFLYAVNAGSDDISVFSVNGSRLSFVQKISAGDQPVSVTIHEDLLYVLNGSVAEQGIMGFRIGSNGRLTPIENSTRMLSSAIAVPGIVQFSPDGHTLLVTHKVMNELVSEDYIIDSFMIDANDLPSAKPMINDSNGIRPFALAFRDDGKVAVVEAFNAIEGKTAVSSYNMNESGELSVISGSVGNMQTDGCWIVISKDQNYAFVANFGSGTISTYRFDSEGALTLMDGDAASLGMMSQPVDLGQSEDGEFLFLLLRGTGGVASFHIEDDGSLTQVGINVGGLPVADGASGLASY